MLFYWHNFDLRNDISLILFDRDGSGHSACRVGKYNVLVQSFEQAALPTLSPVSSLLKIGIVSYFLDVKTNGLS